MREADAIVTLSRRLKDDIISRGIDGDKVFVIANGVDPARFPVMEKDAGLCQTLGLGDGPIIGYVGTMTSYEGLELLVEAFAKVLETLPAARLLIVGQGERFEAVAQLTRALGLSEAVRLTGQVPHDSVSRYYSLIDVFVIPRLPLRVCEIVTPLKPYEAMCSGRAVVLSNVGGLAEIIEDGGPALSFRAEDIGDLAEKCLDLARDSKKRSTLGASASEWVRKNRTWDDNAAQYKKVFDWVRRNSSKTVDSLSAD